MDTLVQAKFIPQQLKSRSFSQAFPSDIRPQTSDSLTHMQRIMPFPISQWRNAQGAFEVANKAAVVVEAAVYCDSGNGLVAVAQAFAGDKDAQTDKVFAGAGAEGFGEAALQLALRETETLGNVGNTQG